MKKLAVIESFEMAQHDYPPEFIAALLDDGRLTKTLSEIMRVIGLVPHPDNKVSIKALEQFLSNIRSQQQTGDSCIEKNWSALHQGVLPSSGSAKVDLAIASIRLLYLQQHRELQTKINELICEVQKITACPKCDLNLGRIGR